MCHQKRLDEGVVRGLGLLQMGKLRNPSDPLILVAPSDLEQSVDSQDIQRLGLLGLH